MTDKTLFKSLPWGSRDARAILVKIAWHEMTGGGACETPALKPWTEELAQNGLVDRTRLDNGRVRISLTPAGRDFLFRPLLEAAVGRPLTGYAVQWTESQRFKRLVESTERRDQP